MSTETETKVVSSKRKRDDELAELEVDVTAAEPPSKKALRKAKKAKVKPEGVAENGGAEVSEVVKPVKTEAKSDGDSSKRSGFGIWIGNLSFTTTKDDLMKFLTSDSDHPIEEENVTRIHLPNGQAKFGKPQNKGFAYVDFVDETNLNHGLELSEKLLSGRRVLIKNATSYEGRPASKEDVASGKTPSRRIFVGNLSFDTTKEALEHHFGVCGNITKTQVATFEDSGKCKGYAWVEFEQLSSAQSAMRGWVEEGAEDTIKHSKRRLWLKKMDGRALRMEFAEDATTRYNKRFGKEAKKTTPGGQPETPSEQQEPIVEVEDVVNPTTRSRLQKDKKLKRYGGYEENTVKKLTGAIAESQGKKVVFD